MRKRSQNRKTGDDLRPEYNTSELKGGVRGKYAASYADGTNLALLEPDVAEHFPNSQAVNTALRRLIWQAKRPARRPR